MLTFCLLMFLLISGHAGSSLVHMGIVKPWPEGGFLSDFSSRACGRGFSGGGPKAPELQGMGGLGRPMACGIPSQWSNLCALQWQGHA